MLYLEIYLAQTKQAYDEHCIFNLVLVWIFSRLGWIGTKIQNLKACTQENCWQE